MIIRLFRATINADLKAEFEIDFREVSLSLIESLDGVVSVQIAKPTDLSDDQYIMISTWENYDAIKAAFGEGWAEPHIPDGMAKNIIAGSLEHLEAL